MIHISGKNYFELNLLSEHTYSGELRFKPKVVRSMPGANATKLGSVSAARINVNSPTIPN